MVAALIVLLSSRSWSSSSLWRDDPDRPAGARGRRRAARPLPAARSTPGSTIVIPFVDRLRPLIDLREQVVSFAPQPVITEDNLVVSIDTVLYFQITDPKAATYEIANYIQAIEQLTVTTLRNVIGGDGARRDARPRATRSTASCAACSTRRPGSGASASTASS